MNPLQHSQVAASTPVPAAGVNLRGNSTPALPRGSAPVLEQVLLEKPERVQKLSQSPVDVRDLDPNRRTDLASGFTYLERC